MPKEKVYDRKKDAGLFIPAGLFIGFGIGFLIDNIPAGIFVGLGLGFLLYALVSITK
jgi:hypothetical protein